MSSFSFTFEVLDDSNAKAFVNGVLIGRVRKRQGRVIFRCGDNPGTNVIRSTYDARAFAPRDWSDTSMTEILESPELKPSLLSIILRNAIRNRGVARAFEVAA